MINTEKLHNIRHSLAHLLAAAILELYPDTKNTIGPAIDDGFYYDFEFKSPISDKDLPKIEKKMREIFKTWKGFTREEKTGFEADEYFKNNEYKKELIKDIVDKGDQVTFYTAGKFTDLCRGGHVEDAKEINSDAFVLDRVAGAYWRGDEKNKMLTRIYGLAFETKEELDAHISQREEAKKRDHKKIGKEQGLFVFSELVGAGLPLWTPKGTIIRELLNDYVWSLRKAKGYQKVCIPHITKKDLYETSGHWAKYADDLFKIHTREDHLYAMKPMNCPHHTQIFDSEPRSYRDMPQRYAETTMVYRDEQSGELSGLSRVLSITQDDAHVFCREVQIEKEALAIWDIIETFYKTFGFDLQVRFSTHDPKQRKKYLGSDETWLKAENALEDLMKQKGVTWIDGTGEAAFYGPKIDFIAKDSIGRVLQVATIQLDFNQPKNFGLVCTNEKGEKEQVVMIHAAIMGSIERFMSTLIEHTAGSYPLWLCPTQISVIPISAEKHEKYAKEIFDMLEKNNIRVELDSSNESLGKRIRNAKMQKVPYVIVIGDKEMEAKILTIEKRDGTKIEGISAEDFLNQTLEKINSKSLEL
ncbi:MAG: threonine--tRNA ligase [Candidatus Nomurabacteria bacterium]|nr:threonine--tRNA ligase [Candidatus Nomurabacteria bacterium]